MLLVCLQDIGGLPPTLVPPCLAACTQLHTLRLQECCSWLDTPPTNQPAASITEPCSPAYTTLHTFEADLYRLPLQTLTAGLQALPNLSSLKLANGFGSTLAQKAYLCALEATCGRLTRLEVTGFVKQLHNVLQAPPVTPKLQHLQELCIPDCVITDNGMCVLLAMSSLTHVAVSYFNLASSHAHKPCSWEEITVYDCLYVVGDLVKLPLQGLSRLVAGCLAVAGGSNADESWLEERAAHDVAAALASVPAICQLTAPSDGELVLKCGYGRGNQMVRLLLPVLARWEGVITLCVCVDFETDDVVDVDKHEGLRVLQHDTVTALAAQLASWPSCTTLEMVNWVPHPTYQLLTALRPTRVRRLVIGGYPFSEHHLMVWCCGDAGRAIEVQVENPSEVEPSGGYSACMHIWSRRGGMPARAAHCV